MDHGQLARFRSVLEGMRREMTQRGQAAAAGIAEPVEHYADENDRASREAEREFLLLLQARDRAVSRDIAEALRRMNEGIYGVCDECGEDIGLPRLKAQPMATLCVGCKSLLEGADPLYPQAAAV
jgi:DnaK suppressor protein